MNTRRREELFGGTGKTWRASGKSGEAKEKSGVSFTTPEKEEELQKKLVNTGRRRSSGTTPRKCGALPEKLVKWEKTTGKRWRKNQKKRGGPKAGEHRKKKELRYNTKKMWSYPREAGEMGENTGKKVESPFYTILGKQGKLYIFIYYGETMKILVAVAAYPTLDGNKALYFVHSRNLYYQSEGIDVTVLNFRARKNYVIDNIKVISFKEYKKLSHKFDILILHAVNIRNQYKFLKEYGKEFPKKNIYFFMAMRYFM